ncbi:anoctamin-10 [Engraulis encrasicolus]|uniref:anoctamin-10 n=1 Tax=Engraulis encrasicolus TaxID=184585 RepID=UPI002FD02192
MASSETEPLLSDPPEGRDEDALGEDPVEVPPKEDLREDTMEPKGKAQAEKVEDRSEPTDWWISGWSPSHCSCCQSEGLEPLVLLLLGEKVEPTTKKWMMRLLAKTPTQGGAGLLVHPGEDDFSDVLLLSAPGCTLLQAAEELGLCRADKEGEMAAFSFHNKELFTNSGNTEEFLTPAERQYIVKYELETLRAVDDQRIPGVPAPLGHLKARDNVFQRLQKAGLVVDVLPLHNRKRIATLRKEWYSHTKLWGQPLDCIQSYFGGSIAFYFSFLDFYTLALMPMAILGVILAFMPAESGKVTVIEGAEESDTTPKDARDAIAEEWASPGGLVVMAMVSMLWSTLMLEFWKRRSSSLAYRWGSNHLRERFAEPRPAFRGELGVNPVTKRVEPLFPAWQRQLRVALVSVPLVGAFLGMVVLGMAGFYWAERVVQGWHEESQSWTSAGALYVPSVAHIVYTNMLGTVYGKVALKLTEWENHREESSFQYHHTTKVLVFTFFNCFAVLFHIAFGKQDLALLQKRLSSLLIVTQLMNQLTEVVVPYVVDHFFNPPERKEEDDDPEIDLILAQSNLPTFPGLFAEYIELLVQFGYLSLFSCVYPLTAFFLLLNNLTELRTDAYKICKLFRKPFAPPSASMGVWQTAFEILAYISVMSNCWFLFMSPRLHEASVEAGLNSTQFLVVVVLVEHILIVVKLMIAFIIPDEPDSVRIQRERIEFNSMKALGQQQS